MKRALLESKYKCPNCSGSAFDVSTTQWTCEDCQQIFPCIFGIPKLFCEVDLGAQDRKLRDSLYDGFFGRFYQLTMPFIVMPVRPLSMAWPFWIIYGAACAIVLGLAIAAIACLLTPGGVPVFLGLLLVLAVISWLLSRQPYLLHLLFLAVPARLSLSAKPFVPLESFPDVHARVLAPLMGVPSLQVLDVSTGSCNSLYKHGWMGLDADFTAIDLSETMLKQGAEMMARNGVPVDLVLGDAMALPFQSDQFDVVLSYGAVNGLTDPSEAIREMARVAKPGGTILFLDEQLYDAATGVERRYFQKVLSSHNVIHRCPVETLPDSLTNVRVSQVYQFYYICTAQKAVAST